MLDEREHLRHISLRFFVNIQRIRNLVTFSKQVQAGQMQWEFELQWEFEAYIENILRATVVLLHAALEDALREIVRLKLSECSAVVLDDIPLVGATRSTKFSLGALSKHRDKTVGELIQESTDQYLNRTSFNSANDIAGMLEKIGIDLSELRRYFPTLERMISRRHQIVHRADWKGDPGYSYLASIAAADVRDWTATVVAFVAEIVKQRLLSEGYPNMQEHSGADPSEALRELALELVETLEQPDLAQALEESEP